MHKLMYAQKNQEFLFENWRYAVTSIFFTVPENERLLSAHQKESMEYFDEFMYKIIQRKVDKKVKNPFSKFEINQDEEEYKKADVNDGIDL